MTRRATRVSGNTTDQEIQSAKRVAVVAGAIGAVLSAIMSASIIVMALWRFGIAPIRQQQQYDRISGQDRDLIISEQVETIAKMQVTPDSSARAVYLENVQKSGEKLKESIEEQNKDQEKQQ